jgi:hypothetical protein
MKEIQRWFTLNKLIINEGKTLVISFHTTQKKKPIAPRVLMDGREVSYNTETKFLGLYMNENMKWTTHIRYLYSKLNKSFYIINSLRNSVNNSILRTMYFACFHSHLRYGVTLWGGDWEALILFRLQKTVVRVMCKVRQSTSCRELFKGLKILPLPSYLTGKKYFFSTWELNVC